MRKVFGIGETILDILFRNDQPCKAVPGGSAFNGILSLGRAGVPVTFISEFGNDRVGRIIRSFMEENGISTEYVDCFPDGKSPVSLAFLDDAGHTDFAVYKDYPSQRLEVAFPLIKEDDIFLFGAYYSLNPVLRSRIVELLNYAREQKAIIYYDPNFRKPHAHEAIRLAPTVLENLEYADIVRGSDEDFFYLFNKTDMQEVYDEKVSFYCDKLITTHGADGVNLFTRLYREHYTAPALTPLSTVGAGDNFNAGFIYGLLKYDIRHAGLPSLSREMWGKLIDCGIEFAADVCLSNDNFISARLAEKLKAG